MSVGPGLLRGICVDAGKAFFHIGILEEAGIHFHLDDPGDSFIDPFLRNLPISDAVTNDTG